MNARRNDLYQQLREQVEAAGCLRPARLASVTHMLIVLSAYVGAYLALLTAPGWGLRFSLLIILAIAGVQSAFIAHEVGHFAVTRNARLVWLMGHVFMTFITGYAQPQYQGKHRQHHAHPNEGGRDPDIEGVGLFTFHPQAACSKRGITKWTTRHQKYLLWFFVSLMPFSSKKDSLIRYFRCSPLRYPAEKIILALHYALWLGPPALLLGVDEAVVNFVLVTWMMGPYLGAAILVNHMGTRLVDADAKMPRLLQTIATTRNLRSNRVCDYLFGGTNNHIEHHLFPSVPIFRLRDARRITRDFCRREGISYREMTWSGAVKDVFHHLEEMSRQAIASWDRHVTYMDVPVSRSTGMCRSDHSSTIR